jgi:hypothetical protein
MKSVGEPETTFELIASKYGLRRILLVQRANYQLYEVPFAMLQALYNILS